MRRLTVIALFALVIGPAGSRSLQSQDRRRAVNPGSGVGCPTIESSSSPAIGTTDSEENHA